MTTKVCALLKSRDSAFRAGDKDVLRSARAKLSRAIREAKREHSQRIHGHFQSSDALNSFYVQFEAWNDVIVRKTIPPPEDQVLCLTTADVRKTLHRVNPRKAAGPDNIPSRVLRECAEQLVDVFTNIFNISLSSAVVPRCLKTTTIILMPKKSPVFCLNDYHPVALTPIIMKCFKRLIMKHIKNLLPPSLDPMQFAYRQNRSTDECCSSTSVQQIIPQHLIEKLSLLGTNTSLCSWILDFLTGSP
ncbi:hypothetical protein QTP86_032717 [Hemibagrus guttatus]|nr:hypothetical protein QTP86_032717 [Hemibagrus guttatus]